MPTVLPASLKPHLDQIIDSKACPCESVAMSRTLALVVLGLVVPLASAVEPVLVKRLGSDRFRQRDRVAAIAYSPDGKLLAAADGPGIGIHLWDATSGKLIRTLHFDEKHRLFALQFAPDGKSIYAAVQADKAAAFFRLDISVGKKLDEEWVYSPVDSSHHEIDGCFSPDGAWLALQLNDGRTALVVNTATHKVVWQDRLRGGSYVSLAFRPDSKVLVAGNFNGYVYVEMESKNLPLPRVVTDVAVWKLAFSPHGKDLVATISNEGKGRLVRMDAKTGNQRWHFDVECASDLNFTDEGKCLMFWGGIKNRNSNSWQWLDAESGKLLDRQMLTDYHCASSIHPNGKVLALGGYDGHISQWDLTTRKCIGAASADPAQLVSDLYFVDKGAKIRGWSQGWYEWDVETGQQTRLSPALEIGFRENAIATPDHKWLAVSRVEVESVARNNRSLELIDLGGGKRRKLSRLSDGDSFHFLPDGRFAVNHDGVALYDPISGKTSLKIAAESGNQVFAVSRDGNTVIAVTPGDTDLKVVCLDIPKREKSKELTCRLGDPSLLNNSSAWKAELSPDGRILALFFSHLAHPGSPVGLNPIFEDYTALFDARTGRFLSTWWDLRNVGRPVFSPDGRSVACYYPSGLGIDLREVATGKRRTRISIGSSIGDCCFDPTGKLLCVATSPGPVELWDLSTRQSPSTNKNPRDRWNALLNGEAWVAFDAMLSFQAQPAQAVALFKEKMAVHATAHGEVTAAQVKDLDSTDFRKREQATKQLTAAGELVLAQLHEALKTASPEARERLNGLIANADKMTPEKLRAIRACEVLEGIGNKEAKVLLAEWAKGAPSATLTREATESLERLKLRR